MIEPEPRWFWWPARQLTYRWRPVQFGGDEWMRRTLGLRLPGGMLWLCLWRFRDSRGPCSECGQWEPAEFWPLHREACPFAHCAEE